MIKFARLFLFILPLGSLLAEPDLVEVTPFFQSHCIDCHGEKKQKGKVRLDGDVTKFDDELWQEIYEQLASGEMPPEDKPQPTLEAREAMMNQVLAMAAGDSLISTTGFRRLNKREYGNTVRDLLGLDQGIFDPAGSVYEDEIDEGFDTAADSLVISNELLLEYLGSAEKSLRLALFTSEREKPLSRLVKVENRSMKGVGGNRYVNISKNHVTLRVGGKGRVFSGRKERVLQVAGRYRISVTASGVDRDSYPIKLAPTNGPLKMGIGVSAESAASVSSKGAVLKTFELKDHVEQIFQFETWLDKDHYPFLSFVNGPSKPITQIRANVRRGKLDKGAMKKAFMGPGIRISKFTIEGPFYDDWPPQSLKTTYGALEIPDLKDDKERAALLRRFANRAFRRLVSVEEIADYESYLEKQHAATGDWQEAIIRTFSAMMASHDFLYLREGQGALEPFALVSRLSYFFWSTMPDLELLELAHSGKITDPAVLEEQVNRMLDDPRARRFSDSFVDQWLSLDRLGTMPPDAKSQEFRIYYRRGLESAMLAETRAFFHHILKDNRSVREFVDSDYAFLNQGLAELYGIPFKGGKEVVKTALPAKSVRGGLLGQGSILALTSNGVETSPVERGHWVLDEFLGTPPPPAPKEVPALVPDLNGADTVRDQLLRHRADPSCMECHRRMDPPGFALEAFDPIGRFRTKYSKRKSVQTDGKFLGKEFQDLEGLKKILMTQLEPFTRSLVVKLAEYGKGRKLELSDLRTVEKILKELAGKDAHLRDLIVRIALSELMTQR